jgi:hypothetical protein
MTSMPAQVYGAGGVGPGIGTFLVGYSSLTNGGPGGSEWVQIIQVDNPLGAVTFTGQFVAVGDLEDVGGVYGFPNLPDAPQLGTTSLIEVNDPRALDAVWRNNSLWFTTTINPNLANDPINTGQATAHWFRLDTTAIPGPILVADQGNVGGEDIAGGTWTFYPALAVNSNGDAQFGFSASATSIYCGAYYAGRESTDPPGTVQASGVVMAGTDYYLRTFGSGRNRWGDFSGASVDPADGITFWIFNEYAMARGTGTPPEDGRWGTAWASCLVVSTLDFGDAPDLPYPTLLASNGARHTVVPGVLMGGSIDAEPDGQPDPFAFGDDLANLPDEDGVAFGPPFFPGAASPLTVFVSVAGWLDVWFDFNQNGSWMDPGEQVYAGPVAAGANVIPVFVLPTAIPGQTFARFRYNLGGPLTPVGPAMDGEVEDYVVFIEEEEQIDFGDAPDGPYPTLLASNGARHTIVTGMFMGALIDGDLDGQPHPIALGDDLANLDDEDGVVFTTPLDPTRSATVDVTVSAVGMVDAWIDFNADGVWTPAEQILVSAPVGPGLNSFNFTVPGTSAPPFNTFARFRYSLAGGLPPNGQAPDGEVEDYEVHILQDTVTGARDVPSQFALHDAVPNPFNPQTTLSFSLPSACHVWLAIYDVRGHLVRALVDGDRAPGEHRIVWNGRDDLDRPAASGVYFYRIEAGEFRQTKRMVLIK